MHMEVEKTQLFSNGVLIGSNLSSKPINMCIMTQESMCFGYMTLD